MPIPFLDSYAQQDSDLGGRLDKILAEMTSVKEGQEAVASTRATSHGDTVLTARTRLLGKLETQEDIASKLISMDYAALSHEFLKKQAALVRQADEEAAAIQEKASVSIFDDPLQAIANEFTMPWDQAAHNATVSRLSQVSHTLDTLNSQANAVAIAAKATEKTLTMAAIDDIVRATKAEIDTKVADARVAVLQSGADRLKEAMNMNHKQLTDWKIQKEVEQQDETMRMRRTEFDMSVKRLGLAVKELETKELQQEAKLGFIKRAVEDIGGTFDKNEWMLRGDTDPKYRALMERGMILTAHKNDKSPVPYAISVDDQLGFRDMFSLQETSAKANELFRIQKEIYTEVAKLTPGKKPDPDVVDRTFGARIQELQKNIKEGDASNPFSAVAWKTVLSNPEVANHYIVKKVIAPQISESLVNTSMSPQQVIGWLRAAVLDAKNPISIGEAGETLNLLFSASAVINTNAEQFEKKFNVRQTRFGYKGYNLMDGVSTRQAMMREVIGHVPKQEWLQERLSGRPSVSNKGD